eukprot:gene21719-33415_t
MSSGFTEAASGFTEEVAPQEEEQPEQQETLETLVRTMELYEEHLQQAEALLETDPTSEEVLKIKQEVVDAMEITQNKITEKRKQATLARIDSLVAGAVAEALLDGVWLFKGDKNIEEVQLTHVRTQKATLPVKRPRKKKGPLTINCGKSIFATPEATDSRAGVTSQAKGIARDKIQQMVSSGHFSRSNQF